MGNGRFDFHEESEKTDIEYVSAEQNGFKEAIYRFQKNKGAVVGFFFVVIIILFSIFEPMLSP